MIEKFFSNYTPVCDYCGARLAGEKSLKDALREMQDHGWENRKRGDGWACVCGDCLFKEKGYDND